MATASLTELFHNLLRKSIVRDAGPTDAQLLEIFIAHRDDMAFEALVRRHGPMVLGVCNRILRNNHDAEDAFQATFLVLACKARAVRPPQMVAGWLYGVACNTALKLRRQNARRRFKERELAAMPRPEAAPELWRQLEPLLDEELRGLPDKFRVPIVLCDLEGKSRKEAARQLGWPEGTVASRLARARQLLAKRLARHGLDHPASAMAAAISEKPALGCVSPGLIASLTKAAPLVGAGKAISAGVLSARVTTLTQGVLTAMFVTKLKIATATLLVLGVLVSGVGHYASVASPRGGGGPGTQTGGAAKMPGGDKSPTGKPVTGKAEAVLELPNVVVDEVDFKGNTISVTIGGSQTSSSSSTSSTSSSSGGAGSTTTTSSSTTSSSSGSATMELPIKLVNLPLGKDTKIMASDQPFTLDGIKSGMHAALQITVESKRLVVKTVVVDRNGFLVEQLKNAIETNAREISDLRKSIADAATKAVEAKLNAVATQGLDVKAQMDANAKAAEAVRHAARTADQSQLRIQGLEAIGRRLRLELESLLEINKKK